MQWFMSWEKPEWLFIVLVVFYHVVTKLNIAKKKRENFGGTSDKLSLFLTSKYLRGLNKQTKNCLDEINLSFTFKAELVDFSLPIESFGNSTRPLRGDTASQHRPMMHCNIQCCQWSWWQLLLQTSLALQVELGSKFLVAAVHVTLRLPRMLSDLTPTQHSKRHGSASHSGPF